MRTRSVVTSCAVALALTFGVIVATASASAASDHDNRYKLTRLVSDKPGVAEQLDPNLVNAWGLVAGPTTPWWVANNGTNTSTLYDGTGSPIPLVVRVAGAPTGTVFNGGSGFEVTHNGTSGASVFLFATENGRIRGWNPNVPAPAPSTKAFKVADLSGQDAIFKGLAIATTASGGRLYATDFHNGRVDVWDENFAPVNVPGAFHDPNLPDGYGPFGIQTIGGNIFVTYAKQDADAEDDVQGDGLGYVDMYSATGTLLGRVASQGPAQRAVGTRVGPRRVRRVQRRSVDRQLRRRQDQRVRAGVGWRLRAPRHPRSPQRKPDVDRRPLGAAVRHRRRLGSDGSAVLHRRAQRRTPRALRQDRGRVLSSQPGRE